MAEILMKAASFVAIIAMGYCLRRAGFFKESDFGLLAIFPFISRFKKASF